MTTQAIEMVKEVETPKADTVAKAGMAGTLGITLYTGFSRGHLAQLIHPWAGIALVGFAAWHTYLNMKDKDPA
ncbi:hypothetical protein MTBBW1_60025 [Desulfamplus magnetovallimortis]|uniref:Uncharacterized protein n=1 Tax=Desulfamplus magnetovallimortis TaxID=1246637 RepID=A0A1W1HI85_9BACT|nr:hypothetical protein [Desulfamplus magnetovallimortis]SLM32125.1 hypothetical protein MTBBW1_60025 [Desulfamplus magnetovallimortis]